MKVEFTYEEIINFIKLHSLFTKTARDRSQTLIEIGVIEDESDLEAIKQRYNNAIYHSVLLLNLIKNSFWEGVIKK